MGEAVLMGAGVVVGADLVRPLCPCCGQDWAGRTRFDAMLDALSPLARKAVRIIARRPGIRGCDLADAVYADDVDGGPEDARKVLTVILIRNRARLAAHGFAVRSRQGSGKGYWLVRLEAA